MIRLKCLLILNSVPGRVLLVEIVKKFSNHQKQKNGMIEKLNQNQTLLGRACIYIYVTPGYSSIRFQPSVQTAQGFLVL